MLQILSKYVERKILSREKYYERENIMICRQKLLSYLYLKNYSFQGRLSVNNSTFAISITWCTGRSIYKLCAQNRVPISKKSRARFRNATSMCPLTSHFSLKETGTLCGFQSCVSDEQWFHIEIKIFTRYNK